MKPGRQNVILEIIEKESIETQQQLMDALLKRGVKSTQATLSRDIRDLKLIKEPGRDGKSHYVKPALTQTSRFDDALRSVLKQSLVSYDNAENLLVLRTLPGLAMAVCTALDGMKIEGLLGTVAGDDTCFLAMKTAEQAEILKGQIHEMV